MPLNPPGEVNYLDEIVLRNYAQLLKKMNRDAEAKNMEIHADELRALARSATNKATHDKKHSIH
jgi:hypothetical protein